MATEDVKQPNLRSLDGNSAPDIHLKGDIVIGTIEGDEARQATEREHELDFFAALKLYPTAVGWSIFFSLGIIMVRSQQHDPSRDMHRI